MPKKSNKSWHRNKSRDNSQSHAATSNDKDRSRERNDRSDQRNSSGRKGNFKPRVGFKSTNQRNRPLQNAKSLILKHLDSDVVMNGTSNEKNDPSRQRRGNNFSYNRSSPKTQSRGPMRYNEFNWYKITIPHGNKYTKTYVISTLMDLIRPETFLPIMYKSFEQNVVFYVDDFKIAKKLEDCNRKFTCEDGYKLVVLVKSETPNTDMNDELKQRIKLVLGKRYRPDTNALDLSSFHQDPDIINDFFCPLWKPTVLSAILDVIKEHVPNLTALSLDSNKITFVEKIGFLAAKLKDLKILHLGNNRIKDVSQLNSLKTLSLEELCMAGNPVSQKYQSKREEYARLVREKFPNLLRLDGVVLPPPIKFDVVEDKLKFPNSERSYCTNEQAKANASQFMRSYFEIFDSDDRQSLLDAYDQQAVLSLTVQPLPNNKFSSYHSESRNLRKITDAITRRKLLHMGKLQVVAFLTRLPKTQHDWSSFTLDLLQLPDNTLLITVTGIFKEIASGKKDTLRYFNRTFTIIPVGTGFCITNEQLYLGEPTSRQEKIAFPAQPVAPEISLERKQQLVLQLSAQTNMNLKYSQECLEVVEWNYEKACAAFQVAFTANNIPPEAFVK